MSQSITNFDIFRNLTTESITIFVRNTLTNDLVNVAATSSLNIIDISDDSTALSVTFGPAGGNGVTRAATGIYQFSFNTTTYPDEYLAAFRTVLTNEVVNHNIFIKSVTARHFKYASMLRLQVDKAQKEVSDEIENMDQSDFAPAVPFRFGVDDKDLIYYLEQGLHYINLVPPYTSFSIDTYPFANYGGLLIDSAIIAYLVSQGIFAIDTDYNYALGGNSFVIDHFSKLSAMQAALLNRFNLMVIKFKQQFRSPGTVKFQYLPGGIRARAIRSLPDGFFSRLFANAVG
jgi:hypothetical protein